MTRKVTQKQYVMITPGTDDPFLFGKWLKERREALDFTQGELADAVMCSLSAIRKVESGVRRPSKQMAELLADQLEIPAEERALFMQFAREVPPSKKELPPLQSRHAQPTPPPPPYSLPASPGVLTNLNAEWQTPPDNLPVYLTSFVGRASTLEQVRSVLWKTEVRLLTLTGPGGVGKTRLAVEAASSLLSDFSDGVFFVSLASIQEPGAVLPAIASTLDVRESAGKSVSASLAEYLRRKNMLLVLDNFEQVMDAAMPVVKLLKSSTRLKMLVTSREPLHVYGEHEINLPPMIVPATPTASSGAPEPEAALQPPAALSDIESVQLFVRRAQAVRSDFRITESNANTIAEICRELDGLPLAIELAAAHCRYLPLEAIRQRLEQGLSLLGDGPRDMPARHRTMRATVEWSYDLLDPEDRVLFRSLGVFAGGFTPEAAQAVASSEAGEVTDERLHSLAGKSLLTTGKTQASRFNMLSTLHEYALEKLDSAGEKRDIADRHARYFVTLAESGKPHPMGASSKAWLDRMQAEHPNMQAALDCMLERVKSEGSAQVEWAELALRLTVALASFLRARGYFTEWRATLTNTLQATEAITASLEDGDDRTLKILRGSVLESLGKAAYGQADFPAAQQRFEESMALFRETGDKQGIARLLNNFGFLACDRSDFDTALKLSNESIEIALEAEDQTIAAGVLNNMANIYRNLNELQTARRYYAQSLALYKEVGDKTNTAIPLNNLGLISMDLEDYSGARTYLEETIAISRELDNKNDLAYALAFRWKCAVEERDYAQAESLKAECLPLVHQLDYKTVLTGCFETEASMRESLGKPLEAARLWGATEALREAINFALPLPAHARYNRYVASARAQANPSDFDNAWLEGRTMSVEATIRYALGDVAPFQQNLFR